MAGVSVLCAVLLLLMAGWVVKSFHGRWLAPGPFFALYWALALALPPIVAPHYVSSQFALWYIVALVAAFLGGSLVGSPRRPERAKDAQPRPLNMRLLRQFVAFGTVSGLAGTVIVQAANGYSVTSILSAQALLDAAQSFTIDRYTGVARTPTAVPMLLGFTYAAALVAPFAARGLSRALTVACYLGPTVGAGLYAVLTTARLGLLTVAFFLFAGWVASSVWQHGEVPRLRARSVIAALGAFALLAGAFVSIAFLRVGSFDPSAQRVMGAKMQAYLAGYMPAFSDWLAKDASTWPEDWGSATLAGLVDFDGGSEGFNDRRLLAGEGSGTTNIFTAWRFLIEDFGVAAALLAAFALGWLLTWAWRRTVEQPTVLPLIVLLAGYAYVLNSNTQTVFLFTNIVAAFFLAAFVLNRRLPEPKQAIDPPYVVAAQRARENAVLSS